MMTKEDFKEALKDFCMFVALIWIGVFLFIFFPVWGIPYLLYKGIRKLKKERDK